MLVVVVIPDQLESEYGQDSINLKIQKQIVTKVLRPATEGCVEVKGREHSYITDAETTRKQGKDSVLTVMVFEESTKGRGM